MRDWVVSIEFIGWVVRGIIFFQREKFFCVMLKGKNFEMRSCVDNRIVINIVC